MKSFVHFLLLIFLQIRESIERTKHSSLDDALNHNPVSDERFFEFNVRAYAEFLICNDAKVEELRNAFKETFGTMNLLLMIS